MAEQEPEFEKPQKPRRAYSVHELRKQVIARHKFLISSKPYDEAIELIQEHHDADEDSCRRFINWLRGGEEGQPQTKNTGLERTHIVSDPETGNEERIETQPGSIPPRPV